MFITESIHCRGFTKSADQFGMVKSAVRILYVVYILKISPTYIYDFVTVIVMFSFGNPHYMNHHRKITIQFQHDHLYFCSLVQWASSKVKLHSRFVSEFKAPFSANIFQFATQGRNIV